MQNEINVTVENGVKELVIREGQAAPIVQPLKVRLVGTITAPRLFLEKRKSQTDVLLTNVQVDKNKEQGAILLTVNDKDLYGSTVEGILKINPDLLAFGINADRQMGLKEIQKFLRMRRAFFADREQNEAILKKLSEFFARITIEINKKDDRKGNTFDSVKTQVEHEIPLEFTLRMPLFQGFGEADFRVEIVADIADASVRFSLESVELQELITTTKEAIIAKELEAFADFVVIQI